MAGEVGLLWTIYSVARSGILTMVHKEIYFSLLPSKMILLVGGGHVLVE